MWNEPALVALAIVVLLVVVLAARPLATKWRWGVAAAAIAATAVAWTFARREIRSTSSLNEEQTRHCHGVASKLDGIATGATVDGNPKMLEFAQREIRPPVAGWITSEMDYCLGWRKTPSCQHALFEAMKETDPDRFADAVRPIARALEAGTDCDAEDHAR